MSQIEVLFGIPTNKLKYLSEFLLEQNIKKSGYLNL